MNHELLNTISRQLELYRKVIKSPLITVAGGAIRDIDNDKDVNDIDIFVAVDDTELFYDTPSSRNPNKNFHKFTRIGQIERITRTIAKSVKGSYASFASGLQIRDVVEINTKPLKTQFIYYYSPSGEYTLDELFRYFDYDICKIAFDGKTITRSSDYDNDIQNKTLSVNPSARGDTSREEARATRMKAKFPDFTYQIKSVVPKLKKVRIPSFTTTETLRRVQALQIDDPFASSIFSSMVESATDGTS